MADDLPILLRSIAQSAQFAVEAWRWIYTSAFVLVLTPAGREVRERFLRRLLDPPAAIRRLSKGEQEQLRDLLRAVLHELGEPAVAQCG